MNVTRVVVSIILYMGLKVLLPIIGFLLMVAACILGMWLFVMYPWIMLGLAMFFIGYNGFVFVQGRIRLYGGLEPWLEQIATDTGMYDTTESPDIPDIGIHSLGKTHEKYLRIRTLTTLPSSCYCYNGPGGDEVSGREVFTSHREMGIHTVPFHQITEFAHPKFQCVRHPWDSKVPDVYVLTIVLHQRDKCKKFYILNETWTSEDRSRVLQHVNSLIDFVIQHNQTFAHVNTYKRSS